MIEELLPTALDADQLGAWHELASVAAEPNPFFCPELLIPAARHLPDGHRVRLAVVRDGRRWLAAVPVVDARSWARIALPCVTAWAHPYSFAGTPLLAADRIEQAANELVRLPDRWRGRAFLALDLVAADGPVAAALRAAAAPHAIHELYPHERAALRRAPENDYVSRHRSGKRRREAARQQRLLARDLGAPAELVAHACDADGVERFLALEASGWKGRSDTALASDREHAAFFRELCAAPSRSVGVTLLQLGTAERTAAMLVNVVSGDTAYALKLAHDEELSAGAPGVTLMAGAADWFHDQTAARRFDSCASPHNPMINGLWPDRQPTASFVFSGSGVSGRVGHGAVRAFGAAQRRRAAAQTSAAPIAAVTAQDPPRPGGIRGMRPRVAR